MKLETKILSIFIGVLLLLMMGSVFLKKNINEKKEELNNYQTVENVQGVKDFSLYPAITNIAPGSAVVGELYRFDIGIVDSDSAMGNIRVEIVDGPDWLKVEGFSVQGAPISKDIGQEKVVLKVSDESHSIYSTFYILVATGNEN